jgi:serine phosphatase RsbU (regulator of sigma subunit)
MQTLADQVALAIQEARLFASVQQEAYVSNALLQVADAVGGLNDVHEIMATVVRIIPLLAGVDRCLALRSDLQKQVLVGDASYGLPHGCAAEWAALRIPYNRLFGEDLPPGNSEPRHILLPEWLSEKFEMREALLLPMLVRGSFLGALCVDGQVPPDSRVLGLLAGIANQAGLALEAVQIESERDLRARLDQELTIGRAIQSSLLPRSVPQLECFDLAAEWHPALEVAGDFFDFIPLDDGRWGIVVADVSDKGVPAAIYMTLARTIIRAIGLGKATRRTPRQVLERANEIIMADARTDLFVTTFYAVLDPPKRTLRYASAGHCPPLLWQAQTQSSQWLRGHGLPLGVLDSVVIEEHEMQLESGDVVVFYTDGVTEAYNDADEMYGNDRLRYTVAGGQNLGAQQVLDSIMQSVQAFSGRREQMDDLTMVVLRCL